MVRLYHLYIILISLETQLAIPLCFHVYIFTFVSERTWCIKYCVLFSIVKHEISTTF